MKKTMVAFFAVFLMLFASLSAAFSASAYTQDQLLAEFKTIPASHWLLDDAYNALANIENLSRSKTLTQAQCDALWPILQEAKALLPTDNGPTVFKGTNHNNEGRMYSVQTVVQMMDLIRKACKVMGWRFVKEYVANQTHSRDIVFKLFDENGNLVFQYDGDLIIQKTGGDEDAPSHTWMLIAGLSLFAFAGGAAFAAGKSRAKRRGACCASA